MKITQRFAREIGRTFAKSLHDQGNDVAKRTGVLNAMSAMRDLLYDDNGLTVDHEMQQAFNRELDILEPLELSKRYEA